MLKVLRTLVWYDKQTDEWIGETRLRDVRITALRKLFGVRAPDPMYDAYAVQRLHLHMLRTWTDVPISLAKYDYFVECSAVGAPAAALSSTAR